MAEMQTKTKPTLRRKEIAGRQGTSEKLEYIIGRI